MAVFLVLVVVIIRLAIRTCFGQGIRARETLVSLTRLGGYGSRSFDSFETLRQFFRAAEHAHSPAPP